ncbi:3'-5' exonuclease [Pseudoalteromonas sp. T1lg65]|uniref:3'-5' exonuclease n=1 Tax=Pseudoalteromonas sp. T1lg65 TaxID=2077101 RepID=UPI003F7A24BB
MSWFSRIVQQWKNSHLEFSEASCVVVDLELTGLDPKNGEIVSLAWLPVESGRIIVKRSQLLLNKEVATLSQSPIYHGVDNHTLKAQGKSLKTLVTQFCKEIDGKVLVAHNLPLDWSFLKVAINHYQLSQKPALMLDTMQIEKNKILQSGYPLAQDALTLSQCRARYGLPSHQVHDALSDALATAELLLAQVSSTKNPHCRIRDLK